MPQAVIPALDANGLAVRQGFGHGPVGPGQHPGDRGAGDLHLLGHFLLGQLQVIGQTHGLELVHGNRRLFQGSQGNPPGFEEGHPRFGFHPTALFGSTHVVPA